MRYVISNFLYRYFHSTTADVVFRFDLPFILKAALVLLLFVTFIWLALTLLRFFANMLLLLCGQDQGYRQRKHSKQFLKSIDVQQDAFAALPERTSVAKQKLHEAAGRSREVVCVLLVVFFLIAQYMALLLGLGDKVSCSLLAYSALVATLFFLLCALELVVLGGCMFFFSVHISDTGWLYRMLCHMQHYRCFKRLRVRKKKVGRKS